MATTSTAVATRPAAPPAPAGAGAARPLVVVEPQARRWGPVTVGAAITSAAQVMLFGALLAAVLLFRHVTPDWAKQADFDNYRGVTVLLTVALVAGLAQWAVHAARIDDQRHAVVALALASGLALAAADLTWYTLAKIGFSAGSSTYATLFYAILGSFVVATLVGAGALLIATFRAVSGQFSPDDHQTATAVAMEWHTLAFVWACIYLTIWVLR